jgi:hypothetical protein
MTPLVKIAAVGVVTVGAVSVVWVNGRPGPQSAQGTPSRRDDHKRIVCVASDSVIHVESGTVCAAGQTPLPLALSPPAPSDPTKPSRHPGDQLADLERRLAALQKSPLFTVVDKEDHPMFAVMPGRAVVYHPSSFDEVVSIGAGEDGGILTVSAANDALRVNIAASASRTGLWSERDGVKRLELGMSAIGTSSLKILTSESKVVAGMGESRAGTGAIVVANRQGQTLASMTVVDDDALGAGTAKGAIGVFNRKGAAVLSLTEGATGGGLLTIGDASSTPMVKMGVKDDRYGVVLAGPRAGFPLVPRSGLPGSYFLGCAGGAACVP